MKAVSSETICGGSIASGWTFMQQSLGLVTVAHDVSIVYLLLSCTVLTLQSCVIANWSAYWQL